MSWEDVQFNEPFEALNESYIDEHDGMSLYASTPEMKVPTENDGDMDGAPNSPLFPSGPPSDALIRSLTLADKVSKPESPILDTKKPFFSHNSWIVMSREELLQHLRLDLAAITEQLFVTEHESEMLMRHYKWDTPRLQNDWFTDAFAVRRASGVYLPVDPSCYIFGLGCAHDVAKLVHGHLPTSASTSSSSSSSSSSALAVPTLTRAATLAAAHKSPCNHALSRPDYDAKAFFDTHYAHLISPTAPVDALLNLNPRENHCPDLVPLPKHFPTPYGSAETQWLVDSSDLAQIEAKQPLPAPVQLYVQCSSAYCDAVPIQDACALGCGHWFCQDCWTGFLQNEVGSSGRQSLFAQCMGMACTLDHNHKHGCKCNALIPLHVFGRFVAPNSARGPLMTQLSCFDPAVAKGDLANLLWWTVDLFVEYSRTQKVRWCSNPRCTSVPKANVPYALVDLTQGSVGFTAVQCVCGQKQCFQCGEQPHVPAPCDLVKRWQQFSSNSTDLWLAAKTKPCPKCKVRIEKNRACNHMTCSMCRHNFCWLCMGDWSSHGSSTGGYFTCKNYQKEVASGKLNDTEKQARDSNTLMHKYNYYFSRYAQHEQGVEFTLALRDELTKALGSMSNYIMGRIFARAGSYRTLSEAERLQGAVHVGNACNRATLLMHRARIPRGFAGNVLDAAAVDTWNDSAKGIEESRRKFTFLLDALDALVECRRLLQWSYVVSYYIKSTSAKGGKSKKQLFEMQQDMLVDPTEHLQQTVEDMRVDLAKVLAREKDVKELIASMHKLKTFIISQVRDGAFEDSLLYEADLEYTQAWVCSCGNENEVKGEKEKQRCSKCGNCRLHDEPECKACK